MDYENQIIEYLDDNSLKTGFVVRTQKNKVQIEDINGKNRRVAEKQIFQARGTSTSLSFPTAGSELENRMEKAAEEVELELLWEMIPDLGLDEFSAQELASEYYGENGPDENSAVFRALLNDPVHFKRSGMTFTARTAQEAEQILLQEQRKAEREAKKQKIMNWLQPIMNSKEDQQFDVPEEMEDFIVQTESFLLRGQTSEAVNFLQNSRRDKDPRKGGTTLLQRTGRLPKDADPFLLENGVFPGFSNAVENLVQEIPAYVPEKNRKDYSQYCAFSIDDESTREVDDALTVHQEGETIIIGIHIADPSSYIHKDDILDRTASDRPLTLYLPTNTVTMLPEKIGCDLASLNPDSLRPTLSFECIFTEDGELKDWTFGRGQLTVAHRLTYDETDSIISGESSSPIKENIDLVLKIADATRAKRTENGAVSFVRPEYKVKVKNGEIEVSKTDSSTPSHRLVSEMMILANSLTASYALRNDVPIIYRSQESPSAPVKTMTEYDPITFGNEVRKMKRTRLSTQPLPHAGLGVDLYTQITSPIRRYADLVTQRQMAAHFAGDPLPYDSAELIEVLSTADVKERDNRSLEREAVQYWLLEYLRLHEVDTVFDATVIDGRPQKRTAEIDKFCVQGRLSTTGFIKTGERVQIKIAEINPRRKWVVFKTI